MLSNKQCVRMCRKAVRAVIRNRGYTRARFSIYSHRTVYLGEARDFGRYVMFHEAPPFEASIVVLKDGP